MDGWVGGWMDHHLAVTPSMVFAFPLLSIQWEGAMIGAIRVSQPHDGHGNCLDWKDLGKYGNILWEDMESIWKYRLCGYWIGYVLNSPWYRYECLHIYIYVCNGPCICRKRRRFFQHKHGKYADIELFICMGYRTNNILDLFEHVGKTTPNPLLWHRFFKHIF